MDSIINKNPDHNNVCINCKYFEEGARDDGLGACSSINSGTRWCGKHYHCDKWVEVGTSRIDNQRLRIVMDFVYRLTELKQKNVSHLCVEEFSKELLAGVLPIVEGYCEHTR